MGTPPANSLFFTLSSLSLPIIRTHDNSQFFCNRLLYGWMTLITYNDCLRTTPVSHLSSVRKTHAHMNLQIAAPLLNWPLTAWPQRPKEMTPTLSVTVVMTVPLGWWSTGRETAIFYAWTLSFWSFWPFFHLSQHSFAPRDKSVTPMCSVETWLLQSNEELTPLFDWFSHDSSHRFWLKLLVQVCLGYSSSSKFNVSLPQNDTRFP